MTTIDDEVALRDQLDLDSMDFLDIVMELKQHKIEIPQEDYPQLATMQSVWLISRLSFKLFSK